MTLGIQWGGMLTKIIFLGVVAGMFRPGPAAGSMWAGGPAQDDPVALAVQGQVRLYAGATLSAPIAYTIDGDKVWVGADTTRPSVYTIRNERVLRSFDKQIAYTFSGDRIYRGSDTSSGAVYTIVGHRVFQGGTATGDALLTFLDSHTHWGASSTGEIVLTSTVVIQGNPTLEFLIPILLLERFQ